MTLHAWMDHNSRQKSRIESDYVDLPEISVLEGDTAEHEILRYFEKEFELTEPPLPPAHGVAFSLEAT